MNRLSGTAPPDTPTSITPEGGDVAGSRPTRLLVVGPRELPESGAVEVWADAGSGGSGQEIDVLVRDLKLAEMDDGQGRSAIYELRTWQ